MARVENVTVGSTVAYQATGPDGSTVTVKNLGPDSCVFATASTVSAGSNDGTLASGSSIAFTPSKYFLSSGTSNLLVTSAPGDQFRQYDRDNGQPGIIAPATTHGFTQTVLLTASRGYYGRFVPSRPMRIVSMSFVVTSFATNDDACDVGIFNSALDTLLGSAGATTGKLNATTGVKTCTLTSPVNLSAGAVYYAGFSVGTVGGTAATVETVSTGSSIGNDIFGATAGLREMGIKASAHPLAAPVVTSATTSTVFLALNEG